MTARVMVLARIREGDEGKFETAYAEVTAKVAGTPGHIRDELLRPADNDDRYILLSEWETTAAFLAWEDAPIHKQTTTPLRPYWAGAVERNIHEVATADSKEN
ncbi:antibiotic biosynthesis monooxygenase family protein [Amycolatopsis sp. H20-H5]|uniref:antibiotic biosynthesis monooxygenase family protein n=1 Tax=Amycolatopsis sp. H20-H5 TaxID=3046309 RepID=UPI002DBF516B|nr:antibiotic biosynthesis monooxygenase family protein [Amycolatopsis sp. H20-H5]MEC3974261.1 antibiotic biosynthesis monooxygenase family protein [Amycolatopsis sp. H20-H5]